jgi:hypothetical protein
MPGCKGEGERFTPSWSLNVLSGEKLVMDSRQRLASGGDYMIILGLVILSSIVWFAAGVLFGYRKGFVKGSRTTALKLLGLMNDEMEKWVYELVKQARDDVNSSWGRFMGFSDAEIKKAKETAKKNYERELN